MRVLSKSKAQEIISIWTKRKWNYSLISHTNFIFRLSHVLLLILSEHIHSDNPDAPICAEFILGKCKNGSKCAGHHCFLPYQWQYSDAGEWKSLNYKDNERLEKLYCDVTLEEFSPMVVRRSNFRKYVIIINYYNYKNILID